MFFGKLRPLCQKPFLIFFEADFNEPGWGSGRENLPGKEPAAGAKSCQLLWRNTFAFSHCGLVYTKEGNYAISQVGYTTFHSTLKLSNIGPRQLWNMWLLGNSLYCERGFANRGEWKLSNLAPPTSVCLKECDSKWFDQHQWDGNSGTYNFCIKI